MMAFLFRGRWIIIIVGVALLLAAVFSVMVRFAQQNPGGNDFIGRWQSTRLFLTQGWSPYSTETTQAVQQLMYGRPARPDEDQALFAYPAYGMLIFAPFALIGDYISARAAWMTVLVVTLLAIAVLSLWLVDWRPGPLVLAVYLLFAVTWYHAVRPVINGNVAIIIAGLLVLALSALRVQHDGLAGALLALMTVKPQMVVLIIPWLLVWAIAHKRWRVIGGFFGTLGVLGLASLLMVPNWPQQMMQQVGAYTSYTVPSTPGAILAQVWPAAGPILGWIITLVIVIIAVREAWLRRQADWLGMLWVAALLLALSQWIGVVTDPTNYIILFVPLILVLKLIDRQSGQYGSLIIVGMLAGLFVGLWWLFLATIEHGAFGGTQPVQHPIMYVPVPLVVLIGLYAVRRSSGARPAPTAVVSA